MSYTYKLGNIKFVIEEENVEKAFLTAKKHFLDLRCESIADTESLNDIFIKYGFESVCDLETGKITDLYTIDNGIREIPKDLFDVIAPFVESGSYIEFYSDNKESYLIKFQNEKCEQITGQIIYPEKWKLPYERIDALLIALVEHEFIARKYVDAAENLIRIGFTGEELVTNFDVEEEAVQEALKRIKE